MIKKFSAPDLFNLSKKEEKSVSATKLFQIPKEIKTDKAFHIPGNDKSLLVEGQKIKVDIKFCFIEGSLKFEKYIYNYGKDDNPEYEEGLVFHSINSDVIIPLYIIRESDYLTL